MIKKYLCISIVFILISGSVIADDTISKVAELRVFFGHQSVGYNIIDGINDITTSFNIVDGISIPNKNYFFLHSQVGENTKPQTKIDDFYEIVNRIRGECDISFLKLCYIDFSEDTDVYRLFGSYKKTIDKLQKQYPLIKFIHFTAPLTTVQKGPKALIKRILGRPLRGEEENIQRQRYNELIRNEYSNDSFIFDIAKIESTEPNGRRVEHEKDDFVYYSLFDGYTYDGGHLNEEGRRIVAEKLIEILSEVK